MNSCLFTGQLYPQWNFVCKNELHDKYHIDVSYYNIKDIGTENNQTQISGRGSLLIKLKIGKMLCATIEIIVPDCLCFYKNVCYNVKLFYIHSFYCSFL